ncbi:MFS transporter [Streptomyces qinzhouensis]|uniref:MFS transporter n=1 Tax=Streptomyces qinzhouensis TaxID=2599401 RepID=A0A5B8J5T5_9ACTN|nr:MFS transporter [Streptomyces qinzhouensis]QDY76657.1 MFS transporter [Streptomyces qinzhouensis]
MTAETTKMQVSTGGQRAAALILLSFVHFMLVLDDSVVNVALATVRDDLGFGTAGLAWVVNAYFLAFGALMPVGGRAADLLGRRAVFLAGVALFGAASLVCGLAQEPWQLIGGRFAQGAGAALASPAALSLVALLYPGPGERARAMGVWGSVAALGGTTGLVVSGVVTDLLSWRWVFLVNVPIAAVVLVLAPRLLPRSAAVRRGRIDVPGAVLGTAALLALVHGLLQGAEAGWGPGALVPLLLTPVLVAAFVAVERRTAEPLVPPGFLAVRVRAVATVASLLFTAAFFAMSFLVMLHLQNVLGYEPLAAGLAYLPYAAGVLTGVRISAWAVARYGVRAPLAVSFAVSAAGLLLLSGISPDSGYTAGVAPGVLLAALGAGLGFPALAVAAVAGSTEEDAGLASALLGSVQQIGGAVGIAALVGIAAAHGGPAGGDGGSAEGATDGFALAMRVAAGALAAGAVLVAVLMPRGRTA